VRLLSLSLPSLLTPCLNRSPTGSNPTGCSSPLSRRLAVLALVRKYNLLLLEDDAYHYLSFDPKNITPSYFELEKSDGGETGRVVRFDSFSKILSSGAYSFSLSLSPSAYLPFHFLHLLSSASLRDVRDERN
jgi:hypothetical protein